MISNDEFWRLFDEQSRRQTNTSAEAFQFAIDLGTLAAAERAALRAKVAEAVALIEHLALNSTNRTIRHQARAWLDANREAKPPPTIVPSTMLDPNYGLGEPKPPHTEFCEACGQALASRNFGKRLCDDCRDFG